jgi:hypothetical protein
MSEVKRRVGARCRRILERLAQPCSEETLLNEVDFAGVTDRGVKRQCLERSLEGLVELGRVELGPDGLYRKLS